MEPLNIESLPAGDVTKVRELLEDDCLEVDAVSGSRTQGKEDILKMMEGVNKACARLAAASPGCWLGAQRGCTGRP